MAPTSLATEFHTSLQTQTLTEVDSQICTSLLDLDDSLSSTLLANETSNLWPIDVAPNQGKLLYLLAKMNRCKRILEIGTLGGYSAIWLAKALPPSRSSKVITFEIEEKCAKIARQNIANAGLEHVIEVKLGPALQTLEEMARSSPVEKFDLVFIDADKENNVKYVRWALEYSKVGTVVVIDNVAREGVPTVLQGSVDGGQGNCGDEGAVSNDEG